MKWRKQLAVLLTVALTGNLGVITPLASSDGITQSIEEIAELSKEVLSQKVSWGTAEEELTLPKTLRVLLEASEKEADSEEEEQDELPAEKGSRSNAQQAETEKKDSGSKTASWKEVSVTWTMVKADNGLTAYDGKTPGVYTFEAELSDDQYEAEHALLPVVTVEVGEEETADDKEEVIERVIELGDIETSVLTSFFNADDGKVELSRGNHELWIDRIDIPDYAREFYDTLAEMMDNDGNEDLLIDDKYFLESNAIKSGDYTFNGIPITSFSSTVEESDSEWNYISNCAAAVVSAFDRDHPEVFWLNDMGRMYMTGTGNGSGDYTFTVYFMYKVHSADAYDIRKPAYRSETAIVNEINKRDRAVSKIMEGIPSDIDVEQVIYFNQWLTKNNEYNTRVANDLSGAPDSAWECTSALYGSIGANGPVCEGYARAFKVLCDKVGIPCVLVDGEAGGGAHMWNYTMIDGEWYAVDVTWDDPVGGKSGAVSGFEGTDWLLLGSDTPVKDGSENFIENHLVINNPGTLNFTNGPELSKDRYPIIMPTVEFSTDTSTGSAAQTVTYTGKQPQIHAPAVRVKTSTGEVKIDNPSISYSYRESGKTDAKYTDGLPVDAGVYEIRAYVASSKADGYMAAYSSNNLRLTIEKAARTISAPAAAEKTDASVTLSPAAPSGGVDDGKIEYAYSADTSVPSGGWQENLQITGLNRNTTYYFFARITGGKNYKDAVSSTGTEIKTDKTKLPKPSLKQPTYAYTGESITAELVDIDSNIMSVSGQSGTKQGNYQVTVTLLSDDYTWNDGTEEPVVLNWKIMQERTLTALTADEDNIKEDRVVLNEVNSEPEGSAGDGRLEYGWALEDNSSKVENWQTGTEFTGLESGTEYYFFARITGGTEYIDVTSASYRLKTKRVKLEKPVLADSESYVYAGEAISAAISGYHAETMTVSGNSAKNVGEYTAKINLTDTKHYEWEDGTAEEISFSWKITKKPVTVKAANKSKYYGEENPALTLEEPAEGVLAGSDKVEDLKVTLSTTAEQYSSAGSYPITGTAAEDSNYAVTVEEGTLTISRKSSGGGGSSSGSGGGSSSGGGGGSSSGGGGGGSRSSSSTNSTSGPGTSLPSYVEKGAWSMVNGHWRFADASGNIRVNNWAAAYNPYAAVGQQNYDWFRFDQNGDMLTGWFLDVDGNYYFLNPISDGTLGRMMTGWVWIDDGTGVQKCYYFNPVSDGYRGKMITNTIVDGYTIDINGCWTVNGVPQVR